MRRHRKGDSSSAEEPNRTRGISGDQARSPFLPSGTKVANARLKESYRFTSSDGKQQTHANWHSLVFYGEVADIALSYEGRQHLRRRISAAAQNSPLLMASAAQCMKCTREAATKLQRDSKEKVPRVITARLRVLDPTMTIHHGLLALLRCGVSTAIGIGVMWFTLQMGGIRFNVSS